MTVTAMPADRHAPHAKSDGRRLSLSAGELVFTARRIIEHYGHFTGQDCGSKTLGFTLDGAVYAAAGFHNGQAMRDPVSCPAHNGKSSGPRPACEPWCERPLWDRCTYAFSVISEGLSGKTIDLGAVRPGVQGWIELVEANPRLTKNEVLRLLALAGAALRPDGPATPARVAA